LIASKNKNHKAAISWSGGKDSCLALLRVRERDMQVSTFVTMCEADGISKSHALPSPVIAAQVSALGGEWCQVCVEPGQYVRQFTAALEELRMSAHTHVVFGDIDLIAHRDFLQPACKAAGLEAVFPLWNEARHAVAREVISRGIRARLVCVDTRWLDESFAGAAYDNALLARLPSCVCPCGEGGEFHSFVWDAPGFSAPLAVEFAAPRSVSSMPPLSKTTLILTTPQIV